MNEMQNKIEQKTFLEMKLVDPFDDMVRHTTPIKCIFKIIVTELI
jgi:hypothetical protein